MNNTTVDPRLIGRDVSNARRLKIIRDIKVVATVELALHSNKLALGHGSDLFRYSVHNPVGNLQDLGMRVSSVAKKSLRLQNKKEKVLAKLMPT